MGRISKAKWCLLGCLIVIFILAVTSIFLPNSLTNAIKWLADSDFAIQLREPSEREIVMSDTLVEMTVDRLGISGVDLTPVVILREKGGDTELPIWIGPAEANAISVVLEGTRLPRPLTPDLLHSVIQKTEASVDYIVINDIRNGTFYANIMLNVNWKRIEVDSRPSDALAVALRVGAPIYAEKAVLDEAGIKPEQKREKPIVIHEPLPTLKYLVRR